MDKVSKYFKFLYQITNNNRHKQFIEDKQISYLLEIKQNAGKQLLSNSVGVIRNFTKPTQINILSQIMILLLNTLTPLTLQNSQVALQTNRIQAPIFISNMIAVLNLKLNASTIIKYLPVITLKKIFWNKTMSSSQKKQECNAIDAELERKGQLFGFYDVESKVFYHINDYNLLTPQNVDILRKILTARQGMTVEKH